MTAGTPERQASMQRAVGPEQALSRRARLPQVRLIADLVCPWCYIGFHRLQRLLARSPAEFEFTWQPFLLNPHLPAEGVSRQLYLERRFGSLSQAHGMQRRAAEIAAREGLLLSLTAIREQPNTLLAHGFLLSAAEHRLVLPTAAAVFSAFFGEGLNIGNPQVLRRIGRKLGLPAAALDPQAWGNRRRDILAAHGRAVMLGINGVPALLIGEDHLIAGAQPIEALEALLDLERYRLESGSG